MSPLGGRRIDRPGRLAQLGERLPYKQEVTGSNPVPPITKAGALHELGRG
jgi:hypothetical protein